MLLGKLPILYTYAERIITSCRLSIRFVLLQLFAVFGVYDGLLGIECPCILFLLFYRECTMH
jgi:hypothetical protein